MLTLVGVALVILAGLVQTSVLPVLLPPVLHLDVRPDLVVLLVVAMALAGSVREAAVWAFVGGLFLDVLAALPLGTNALCLVLVTMLAALGARNPFRAHLVMPLVLAFLSTVFYYILLLAVRSLLGQHFSWLSALQAVALPAALFNTALMPLVYSFLLWLTNRFTPQLPEEWQ
jgi:rod shape-determining protein MreD